MDENRLNTIRLKFINSTNWLNQKMVEYGFSPAVMLTVSQILREAQAHTLKTTGCTKEKFDSIFNQPNLYVGEDDLHIFQCYCDYLDNTRKVLL